VLDADALNAIAHDTALQAQLRQRSARGAFTVSTPHPLEAARLLGVATCEVMRDRLRASLQLAAQFGALCVLKGSGTVIAAPGTAPQINPTGNAALATAGTGTGDVLAGMVGAALTDTRDTTPSALQDQVAAAVYQHGWLAEAWVSGSRDALSADRLTSRTCPLV
jgi:NAD(P)H-hydrate repair Nnr-like enzyme with NAD(P)H-hydrate dehydratase domain